MFDRIVRWQWDVFGVADHTSSRVRAFTLNIDDAITLTITVLLCTLRLLVAGVGHVLRPMTGHTFACPVANLLLVMLPRGSCGT